MDPTAALRTLYDAGRSLTTRHQAADDLAEWLQSGGFTPSANDVEDITDRHHPNDAERRAFLLDVCTTF